MPLLEVFAQANNLVLKFESRHITEPIRESTIILYEEDSETDTAITFMSIRHLGFQNMLHDYLIRCGIDPVMIPVGKFVMRKTSAEMEEEWQKHRKEIGLI